MNEGFNEDAPNLPVRELARKYGMTRYKVCKALSEMGIMKDAGMTYKKLTSEDKEDFREDVKTMTVENLAVKWRVRQSAIYNWMKIMGLCKRMVATNNSIPYKGFKIYRSRGSWFIQGSALAHSKKGALCKFIDTYLRRTGKEAGEYAT